MRSWSTGQVILRTGVLGAVVAGAIVAAVTVGQSSSPQPPASGLASRYAGGSAAGVSVDTATGPDRATAITRITLSPFAADTSPPLSPCTDGGPRPQPTFPELRLRTPIPSGASVRDPVLQEGPAGPNVIPAPAANFDGATSVDNQVHNGFILAPPDNDGDIGKNHYIQFINELITIYTKTGTLVLGPCSDLDLWRNFADATCRQVPEGDTVIAYDRAADRWVLAEFAFPLPGGNPGPPYHMCLAVSTSGDPTGTYYRYSYEFVGELGAIFPDYPKLSIWPDGYYMSINEFGPNNPYPFRGGGAIAYDRTKMLAGNLTAQAIWFHGAPWPGGASLPELDGGLLPSDLDSQISPPAGDPNIFLQFGDNNGSPAYPADVLKVWKFHADFAVPANSTFTNSANLTPAAFDSSLCGFLPCVPQPGTVDRLDTLSDRLMYRLVYRRFTATTGPTSPPHETWVVNHTVDVDSTAVEQAGIRWYELRDLNTAPSIFQQGTFAGAPQDAKHRWMASANIDTTGNIALGYSISDGTAQFPSVFYTGRLVGDTLGTLPQGEGSFINGTGSQLQTQSRWGDYTTLDVDPVDECTFWHTNEYYAATGTFNWMTRIGAFKLPTCVRVPTAVAMARFGARWQDGGVALTWKTATEADLLGFNLYRLDGKGRSTRVNSRLLPARHSGTARGAGYRFVDRAPARKRAATYKLQVVDLEGARSWYGVGAAPVR